MKTNTWYRSYIYIYIKATDKLKKKKRKEHVIFIRKEEMLAFVWKELLKETHRSKSLKQWAKYRNRRGVQSEEAL